MTNIRAQPRLLTRMKRTPNTISDVFNHLFCSINHPFLSAFRNALLVYFFHYLSI
jgi:hypothetical protein